MEVNYYNIFSPIIHHKTPESAWNYAMRMIHTYGNVVRTEDNRMTKELMNLVLTVNDPMKESNWPIPGTSWRSIDALDEYAAQLLNPDVNGFDYTYGNRIGAHIGVDDNGCIRTYNQLDNVITKLSREKSSRRAVMVTWYPGDIFRKHVPCMIMNDFLIRDEKLYLTAVFRSHDIERAWPANVYGLGKMMQIVADSCDVRCGSITTVSISAHIYI